MTLIVGFLLVIDLILVATVIYLSRHQKKGVDLELLKELHQEKDALKEIARSLSEDLHLRYEKSRQLLDKMSLIATELDAEIKDGKATIAKDISVLLNEYTAAFKQELGELSRQKSTLGVTIQQAKREREVLSRALHRANRLAMFFKKKVPYEEVLEEIEDKKYVDARFLLSQGMVVKEVAAEVGLPESEVQLLTAIT